MNIGVHQMRENEKNRATLIGISTPAQIAVRRRKSMAPLRAAAYSAVMEGAVPGGAVPFMEFMDMKWGREWTGPGFGA